MKLRPATINDIDILRHWDEQPHVRSATNNADWQWDKELVRKPPWREQLIAEEEGRPIGYVEIIDPAAEESHYWGEIQPGLRAIDLWIGEAADLGKGYGTRMMRLAIERCFSDVTVTAIIVDPLAENTRACRFYESLGFRILERRTFPADEECVIYRLDRSSEDKTKD